MNTARLDLDDANCQRGRVPQLTRLVLAAALASGCVTSRDFRAPSERITPNTAYAEHARVRVDTDVLAADPHIFLFNLGLTIAAIRGRLDFSANLAHGALGVVNLQSKFTLIDTRWYGLGGRVGFVYANPRTLYVLPPELRRELGSFHLISAPIELWHSFPINEWFAAHLGMSYRGTGLSGQYEGDELLVDTSIAQRWFALLPALDFFIARRVALRVGARLPIFTQVVEATDVQQQLEPELIVGVRSVEWIRRPFARTVVFQLGAETRFGRSTHLLLGVNVWAFRPLERFPVTPWLSLYWRFR
jgi:hypothetical protein